MIKKPWIIVLFGCIALICGAAVRSSAQGRGQGMGPGMGMGQRGARVRENLATLRLLRMTQALDLSEDQTAVIFPFINKIEKEKLSLQRQMTADIQELRRTLAGGEPQEAAVLPLVERIRAGQGRIKGLDADSEAFLEKQLTPIQRGKYVIFQIDFYRMLEQAVTDLRSPGRAAPPAIKK